MGSANLQMHSLGRVYGVGVVCTRLPRGRLYTSAARSFVHVYLLAFALLDTIEVLKGSEVAMLPFFCGMRNVWWHCSDFGLSFRGRRIIWCGCSVNFHGMR